VPEVLLYQVPAEFEESAHSRLAAGLHHLCFSVESRDLVDQLFELVAGLGAEVLDPPIEYPQYSPRYYATYFLDPDGMKIEIAHLPDYTPSHVAPLFPSA
jgi:catechol 2,3-dioxygenase-like lactoylglutathione lyase family enzyme